MGIFAKAERKRVALKIAITGPSGSGKTFSALKLAQGMGKKIALLDTENGSGSLYAGLGEYDTVQIHAPYTIPKYLEVIRAAESEGYDVLIIDSLSHAWAGEGGLLQKKESMDSRGGNNFANWATITKEQEAFKAAILQTSIHVIATMRSKQEYVQEENDKGRKEVRKVGMAPIQRDGFEYEFTCVFDVDMQHYAMTAKDRTGLFDGVNQQITEKHGQRLMEWLQGGAPLAVVQGGVQEPTDTELFDSCKAKRDALLKPGEKANIWEVIGSLAGCDAEEARTNEASRKSALQSALSKTEEDWTNTVDAIVRKTVDNPPIQPKSEPTEAESRQTVGAMQR